MRKLVVALLFLSTAVLAQQAAEIWGTVYLSTPPAPADKQTMSWRSNSTGKLVMDGLSTGCSNAFKFNEACNSMYLGGKFI